MSLILLFIIAGAITMTVFFFVVTKSDEGFEDEHGFHYGTPSNKLYRTPETVKSTATSSKLSGVYTA